MLSSTLYFPLSETFCIFQKYMAFEKNICVSFVSEQMDIVKRQ